jgi:exopolyphosphatase/guanosine-5'-triphosphate,3'-diphosphate pyrophosphatase
MAGTSQRWEWRTFGRRFGEAESAFAAMTPTATQESDELYLLTSDGDTVKVRADLMDVKTLREVNQAGLERWEPVMKAGFPLSPDDAAAVIGALRVDGIDVPDRPQSLDEFLDLVTRTGRVRAVKVHKRRVRYTVGGCSAEFTDVTADQRATRTIAIESEDPAAVIAAVRSVGLGGFTNTSYPRGLMALIDDRWPRYAVIDVGTNSVKFHVGELDLDGVWHAVIDRAEVTRLGEGIEEHGEIAAAARDRTVAAIAGMVDEAKRSGAVGIAVVGTAGLRAATNRDDVIAAILDATNLRVEVISGDEEARLAYLATKARLGLDKGTLVVFDTGGGSTQFTMGHGTTVDERFSVPIGAVRITERFGLDGVVAPSVLDDARTAISADLARIDGTPRPDGLVAMGGAVTNMAAVMHGLEQYDPEVVQGTVLDRSEIDRQIELYRSRDAAGRREIVGLQPARAEVILAGTCVVRTIMEKLDHETLTVSDRGLRHGLLIERFGP